MNKITLMITALIFNVVVYSQVPCTPISTLDCSDISVSLPYSLDFDSSVSSSLVDNSGNGIGFTMALEHSEIRRPGDLPVSNFSVNGYEPTLLNLSSGILVSTSQRGIAYLDPPASSNNNNQINTLGVGVSNMSTPFLVKAKLLNIITGEGSAQAGIWYGFDEDNFVKLNVNNNNIEIRVESGGLSSATNQMQVTTSPSGQDVILELVLDPAALTVEAIFTVGTGNRNTLGKLDIPADYFVGRNIGGANLSFAGIYTTHRSGTQFSAAFDDFSVEEQVLLNSGNDIASFILTEQTEEAQIDVSSHSISLEVNPGTDVTSLVPTIMVSDDAVVSPLSDIAQNFQSPVTYTVTAEDGSTQDWTINVTVSNPILCSPISPLDCNDIVVNLPYALDFESQKVNTLNDNLGNGTGFTMALDYTASRSPGDLIVSNPSVIGYEPSLLNLSGGILGMTSQRGISYLAPPASSNNNNQINSLGIGIPNSNQTFLIKSSILNVITGTGGAQAGIWYGYDEDNFVKLNINNSNIEMRVESGGLSTGAEQLQVAASASGEDVLLELMVDPNSLQVEAFFTVANGVRTSLGLLPLPSDYFVGRNLGGMNMSFAGIYTTHRSGTQFSAAFDDFSVEEQVLLNSGNDIASFVLTEQTEEAQIDVSSNSILLEVNPGTDVTSLVPTIMVSDDAVVSPLSGIAQNFQSPVTYTVTAEDGSAQDWTVIVKVSNPVLCSPISPLDCTNIAVALPYSLNFDAPVANTLLESASNGSGFTMALEHSAARSIGDLSISNPAVNGYESSLLSLSPGVFSVTSQRGISYLAPPASSNNNNQVNSLGVGFLNTGSSTLVKTKVLNLVTGTGGAQAGIWYGFDEDNFVKLNVNNSNVELRVESGGLSTGGNQVQTAAEASGQDVTLEMLLDPITMKVEAFYTLGTGTRTLLGVLDIPANYFTGRNIEGTDMSFAGIYTTHRSGTQFTAVFDSFDVQGEVVLNTGNDVLDVVLVGQTGNSIINTVNHTVVVEVPNGTDTTFLTPSILVSEGATVVPDSGTAQNFNAPVTYTVTAEDGTSQDWNVTISNPVLCSPISPLDCDDIAIILPYNLNFDVPVSNTLVDNLGSGIGFTMALEHSASRSPGDLSVSNVNVNGYEPSLIDIGDGSLSLLSQKGISYLAPPASSNNNNQINSLGVGITSLSSPFVVSSSLLNIVTGGNGAQAGIWFGNDEDNFVKLNVVDGTIEMRVESVGLSGNSNQLLSAQNASGQDVELELLLDPISLTVEGFFTVGLGTKTSLGTLPVPSDYFLGKNIGGTNMAFAGLYATHRNGSQFTANFDSFSIETTVVNFNTNINFTNGSTAPPADYLGDSGQGFATRGNGLSYGWLDNNTSEPVSLTQNSRNRNVSGVDVLQNTFIHIQYGDVNSNPNSGYLPDAKWEIAVPNGAYQVTVSLGDPDVDANGSIPSHTISAEGFNLINKYIPTGVRGSSTRFTTGTGVINVIDGRLTLEPTGGFNTKINYVQIANIGSGVSPFFNNVTPENNAVNVLINDFQANVELIIPSGYELDNSTLADNVNLYKIETSTGNETLINSNSNDTGGGDAVTLTPLSPLEPFTSYVFRLSSNIEVNRIGDLNDRIPFIGFESKFITGELGDAPVTSIDLTGIEFTKVEGGPDLGPGTSNERFSSLVIGPDGKLYGSTIGNFTSDGKIFRWDIEPDGTLSNLQILSPSLQGSPHPVSGVNNSNNRMIIGLTFDPASTENNLIAYISHNMASITDGPEWDGKISRLSGPDLTVVQDIVIHLPRSSKDHLTNSLAFDAAGDMYINQGSNSAGGEPDPIWANRPERLLSGAVLKLDLDKLGSLPLDGYTTDNISVINSASSTSLTMSDGTYNPYSSNSPLTIFSSGVRNAYDLVWHSNGWLYVPVNGTAGNTVNSPNTPSTENYTLAKRIDGLTSIPSVPAIFGGETQKDFLYKTKGGDYHGHPNPYRGEFVLNHGGKAYSGLPGQTEATYIDVTKYSDALLPDLNYAEPAYDFGKNKSPNGVIEYKSDAFGGRLNGLLMVVRFSGQDDILVMNPKGNGDIGEAYNSISGLGGLDDPLDLVEDPRTGNIYVSEYDRDNNGIPRLTLLRATIPATIAGRIETDLSELVFEVTNNDEGPNAQTKAITVTNTGNQTLNISDVAISGSFSSQFNAVVPSGALSLEPESSQVYTITYAPDLDGNDIGYQDAKLIITNDGIEPTYEIGLFALKKIGLEGNQEPALQDIVDALGIGIDVGWDTVENNVNTAPIGDELSIDLWVRASEDPVVVIPVGRYSPEGELPFGWFTNDNSAIFRSEVGTVASSLMNAQTLYPSLSAGGATFNPGNASFGLYVQEGAETIFYTQDAINTPYPHRTRIYPRNDREGNPIENSYFIGYEASFNGDYQDYLFIVENVTPFNAGATIAFGKNELEYTVSTDQDVITTTQELVLSQQGNVNVQDVSFTASESWVVLPTVEFGTPMHIGVDPSTLVAGTYTAVVTAQLTGFEPEQVNLTLTVLEAPNYSLKFNFQANPVEASPADYINDIGTAYGIKQTTSGEMEFGWVVSGTVTPLSAAANARNRNNGVNNDGVNKTLTILGHRSPETFPTRDWLIKVPNGNYYVNLGVGDSGSNDSRHILDVNSTTVLNFDQETNNPNGFEYFNDTKLIEVNDGFLRLSLNDYGVNVKLNYIKIAPVDISEFPPIITADFEGNSSVENVYRGLVSVVLQAEDQTGNDNIVRLDYTLDSGSLQPYTIPVEITNIGSHVLEVEAEDGLGNITQMVYNFVIEPSSGAQMSVENMTKVPGTSRGFPADDYYSFHRIGQPILNGKTAISHESNVMRIRNEGSSDLVVTDVILSNDTYFTYNILPGNDGDTTLPISVSPGDFKDVNVVFVANLGAIPNNVLLKENLQVVSNADNGGDINVTLHGSYSPSPGGSREVDPQEVVDVFGLKTNIKSIVNTMGTISPPNIKPGIPVGQYPLSSNVDAGYDGDLVVSPTFVQADPNQPVRAFSLATYAGGPSNIRFIRPNSTTLVGGINFTANTNWYNTILSRNSSGAISNDSNSSINEPFRVVIAGRTSSGGTNTSGSNPQMLYVRLYKVRDHDGKIIPNEYIGMQDFSGGGGCGPCDWNDNMIYIMNIRPENLSSALASTEFRILADEGFEVKSSSYLDSGYPGNELQYSALLNGVNPLPSWMIFNSDEGTIRGVPPISAIDADYDIEVSATDLNGTILNTTVILKVVDEIPSDLPWVETFEDVSNGSVSDSGDTEWSSTRSNGDFEVQNGRFIINGSGGTGTWSSEVMLVDGEVNVSIDIDDDTNSAKENSDFIRAFYVLDGGNPVQFGSVTNDISAQTFSVSGITGSTLQILVEAAVSFSDESYFFDNISITKAPLALRSSLNNFKEPDMELSAMKLYPNPASTTVWLEWNHLTEVSEIVLYDPSGRIIDTISGKMLEGTRSYLMNVNSLNNGLYFIRAVDQRGDVTIKKLLINK